MPAPRSLYWRLNWYRQSELEGALLLGRLIRRCTDAALIHPLTEHCADEARHACMWSRTLRALDMPIVRIHRPYQAFYAEALPAPRSLLDVLALTNVFEQRVHAHFTGELMDPEWPEAARRTFRAMLRDERRHLDWVGQWLATQPLAAALLTRIRQVDERIVVQLTPYRDRLWDIPGLGDEGEDDDQSAPEELHAAQPQHSP